MRRIHAALLAGTLVTAGVGCTSVERSYPGYTRDQVWTAMRAVAEQPEYDDWKVMQNEVWVDEEGSRIEVRRSLARDRWGPGLDPAREESSFDLTYRLLDEDPPTVEAVSRGAGVPSTANQELTHYLTEVGSLLGMPAPPS